MRFVLVHGAWHDERSWYPVAGLLRQAGHEVTTPTLTGLGVRASEMSISVGLDTHVQDLVAHLERHDLDEVVLVAHSYGAVVARAAAAMAARRIRQLVLVEGWTPADGQSMADVAPDWFMPAMRRSADRDGDGWRIPPPTVDILGVEDPALASQLIDLLSDHPLRTFTGRDLGAECGRGDSVHGGHRQPGDDPLRPVGPGARMAGTARRCGP